MFEKKLFVKYIFLGILFSGIVIPFVSATEPTFSLTATPNKPAYYIGEDVKLSVNFEYKYLTSSHNVSLVLTYVNGTLIQYLANLTNISGNGIYTNEFTISGLTDEIGTFDYYVKAKEGEIILAQAKFTINVAKESYQLIVAWIDASGDRKIDPQESVTFNIYLQWNFVNESRSIGIYLDDTLLGMINITTSSGSDSLQYQTAFDEGEYTLVFEARFSNGTTITQKIVNIKVGEPKEASLFDQLAENSEYVLSGLALITIIVVVIVLTKKR